MASELATLAGGCFWCLEAVYREVRGVQKVESGYTGGSAPNPTYRDVCMGDTGHAEVVQVTFDPAIIPYRALLEVFFSIHDPTTLNRQGADVGTQYRSIILAHGAEQQALAAETVRELEEKLVFSRPIVTQLEPLRAFFKAEDYHQGYYRRNPYQGYCQAVISPKVAKMRKHWAARLKAPGSPA